MAVTYLRTKHHLSKREARWVEFLADYHFTIHHKPGKDNVADPLPRRPDLNTPDSHQDQGAHLTAIEYGVELNAEVSETVSKACAVDKEFSLILDRLKVSDVVNLHDKYFFDEQQGHLYLKSTPSNRLCVPQCPIRLKLI